MKGEDGRRSSLKRFISCVFAAVMCFAVAGCAPQTSGDDGQNTGGDGGNVTPPETRADWELQAFDSVDKVIPRPQVNDDKRVEILKDLNFSGGFTVYGINANEEGATPTGYLLHDGKAAEECVWQIAQWGCSHRMAQEAEFSYEGSVLTYQDPGKTVTVDTAKTGCATLRINGSAEYSDPALYKNGPNGDRNSDENWPHLYLAQQLNYDIDPNAEHLYMELNYKVTECSSDHVTGNRGDGEHAGMFVWFLLLTDANPESPSFNQQMWFGVKMYDTRYVGGTPPAEGGPDNGKEDSTGLFIYIPSLTEVAEEQYCEATVPSSVIGQDGVVKFDILHYIPKMLDRLGKLTDPPMEGASIEHMRIVSTNFGWELMGNNDAEVEISYINLYSEY